MKYYQIGNQSLPSVTTILAATKDPDKTAQLKKWEKKMQQIHGENGAEIERNKAMERGTKIHQEINNYLLNQTEIESPLAQKLIPFLKLIQKKLIYAEKTVWTNQYAGTLDCLCKYEELTTLIDWKTSNTIKRKDWIEDHFIQAAAYAQATKHCHNIQTEQTLIVIISPQKIQQFSEQGAAIKVRENQFNERLEAFNALS